MAMTFAEAVERASKSQTFAQWLADYLAKQHNANVAVCTNNQAVPDLILRDAYTATAEDPRFRGAQCDSLLHDPAAVENMCKLLGPEYAHLSASMVTHAIVKCRKDPNKHGGKWQLGVYAKYGAHLPLAPAYLEYRDGAHFQSLRIHVLVRSNYQCRICPRSTSVDVYHRTFMRIGCEQLSDVYPMCGRCRNLYKTHNILPYLRAEDVPVEAELEALSAFLATIDGRMPLFDTSHGNDGARA